MGGRYRTSDLKEYPSELSRFLALAFLDVFTDMIPDGVADNDLPPEGSALYVPLDPFFEFVQQHDCALGGEAR